MALITHQTQNVFFIAYQGYSALSVRAEPCSTGAKFNSFVAFQLGRRADRLGSLRHHNHFRGKPYVLSNQKPFKISSFKSSGQTDESNETDRASKFFRKSVHPSCVSEEREETLTASPDVTSSMLSSENRDDTVTSSQAIKNLFKKWSIMLHSQTLSVAMDDVYSERPTDRVLKNHECSPEEKPKAYLRLHFFNMDYKALGRQMLKQLKEWAVETYLDYVESIWPYYCRTIRFLKKANLL
ncbi:unnamed protein product [Spirodela intermedia]|uniref:Uncharacterized protein n=1 Tax=Spirodela intermedia TaxID=51605 RepID=A0A7I8ITU4_SPIIN|nr:unnamed protein product [Spirodela intermedia]CAA6661226.1 unnamed protein product [Spirodela intermedia]